MNINVAHSSESPARRLFTVAEIRRMVEAGIIAENEHFELIDGEVVLMSPKGNQHEVLKAALAEILTIKKPPDLRLAQETTLYLDEHTFVEPDVCLYPRQIMPEDVAGTDVILAVEVAGASLGYDRGVKARLYARYGVNEFWVVDAATRDTWVHRRPQSDGNWGSIEKIPPNEIVSALALPKISIRMADLT